MYYEALRQEYNMQLVVPRILLAQRFYLFETSLRIIAFLGKALFVRKMMEF